MKNLFLIFCFLLVAVNAKTQNLVNNPSFETYSSCPTIINQNSPDQVAKATGWYSSLGSPDYFNSCATIVSQVNVPNNQFGYQYAATGNAFCGFHTWSTGGGNYREIISSQLSTTLIIGQEYFVSFKVSFGDSPAYYGIASDKMGVKLSTVQYSLTSPPPINNTAQVYSSTVITDTLNWVRIKGSFISDSLYQYINIGSFFDDANTDTSFIGGSGNEYYYIDDICISLDSNSCYSSESIQEIAFQELSVYPNPANEKLTIEVLNTITDDLDVLNSLGEEKLRIKTKGKNQITIDCADWSNGLYLIKTKSRLKKIIIQHNH